MQYSGQSRLSSQSFWIKRVRLIKKCIIMLKFHTKLIFKFQLSYKSLSFFFSGIYSHLGSFFCPFYSMAA